MLVGTKVSQSLLCLHELQSIEQPELSGQSHGYKYHKLEALNSHLMPVIHKWECVLIFSWDVYHIDSEYHNIQRKSNEPKLDKLVTDSQCSGVCRLQYIKEREDYVEISIFGHFLDTAKGDKSMGSITIARRYALLTLAGWGTNDYDDPDAADNQTTDSVASSLFTPPKQASNTEKPKSLSGIFGS